MVNIYIYYRRLVFGFTAMTEWQWKLIMAMARLLLIIVKRHPKLDRDLIEERDQFIRDVDTLEEGVRREF